MNAFKKLKLNGRLSVMMGLLIAGSARDGDYSGTNKMPAQVHNLIDSHGYAFSQKPLSLSKQNTNSLRNVPFIEPQRFIPFLLPAQKTGWSLWNNSNFKYVRRNTDPINLLAPFSALSLYEYDITYSFGF